MTNTLFFDTYAFFELLDGNPAYARYVDAEIVTTKVNLFELYYGVLQQGGEHLAKGEIDKYMPFVIDFDSEIIELAAKFKYTQRQRKLSMVDCIGYITAQHLGVKFLTGDRQFEGMPGVEFAK